MKYVAIRNWQKYQHYKDRRPLWVKLHLSFLDDPDMRRQSQGTRLLAVLLLCLAASKGNQIPKNLGWMVIELNMPESTIKKGIRELLNIRFIEDWTPKHSKNLAEDWGTRYIKPAVREYVLERDGQKCVDCLDTEALEIDHITPVSRGGSSDAGNLQVLCRSCNRRKRATVAAEEEWSNGATQVLHKLRSLETETEEEPSTEVSSDNDPPIDPIWDSLVTHFGDVPPRTNAHAKRNKAVGDLRKMRATPDGIESAIKRYGQNFPGIAATDIAIATHYPKLILGTVHAKQTTTASPPPCPECEMGGGMHVADCSQAKEVA